MTLRMHPAYEALIDKAYQSHEKSRSPEGITADDIMQARLYSYAFRLHTIGTFHATGVALQARRCADPLTAANRRRAVEGLQDLADQAMEPVPEDFRVVLSTLYRYHRSVLRVIEALENDYRASRDREIERVVLRFADIVQEITSNNGIHLTRDVEAPTQAAFVVPNLGITIVPLVYGDHHSWNLAYLDGEERNVPTHRHRHGVEIHLGYNPTQGQTVLGRYRANIDEGYAMPIPPNTDHGWVNTSDEIHHVPFIFGSLKHSGWGVFLDVIPQPRPVEEITTEVDRESPSFSQMVYLEREIEKVAGMPSTWRSTLIPHTVTNREGSGGLELSLTRINPAGYAFDVDEFRIVSVVRGEGKVRIEGVERDVKAHDHFGVPGGLRARVAQRGRAPMVVLDSVIRTLSGRRPGMRW